MAYLLLHVVLDVFNIVTWSLFIPALANHIRVIQEMKNINKYSTANAAI